MRLIKGLYMALAIVTGANAITSLYLFWPRVNTSTSVKAEPTKSDAVWTWKDTIWIILMLIAVILLVSIAQFMSSVYITRFLMTIIMISYILGQIASFFPSAETVGNIVRGKASKILGANDYSCIITLAILVSILNTYGILDKAVEYVNCQTNTILSDWMMLGFYVVSIAITTFFICSLALTPLKIAIKLFVKISSRFSNWKERPFLNKLKKRVNGTYSTKTWTVSLIECSINHRSVVRYLFRLGVPITIILDILRLAVLLVYELAVSIVWHLVCITMSVGKVFSKIGKWILSLSDRNVVIISFRIAIILGLGCTVVINQYEPFLINPETTSVFEFLSSTIIIPVILEWILSYKTQIKM